MKKLIFFAFWAISAITLTSCGTVKRSNPNYEATHKITVSKYDNMETDEYGQIIFDDDEENSANETTLLPDLVSLTIINQSGETLDDIRLSPSTESTSFDSVLSSSLSDQMSTFATFSCNMYDDENITGCYVFILPEDSSDYIRIGYVKLLDEGIICIDKTNDSFRARITDSNEEPDTEDSLDEINEVQALELISGTWYLDGDTDSPYFIISKSGKYAYYEIIDEESIVTQTGNISIDGGMNNSYRFCSSENEEFYATYEEPDTLTLDNGQAYVKGY